MSFTPAMSSVALKYLSAESPPRFRRLYTRYLSWEESSSAFPLLGRRTISDRDVLCDLTEGAALLAEVHDETDTATLGTANAFLDGISEVGFACADVGAEDIGTVAYGSY